MKKTKIPRQYSLVRWVCKGINPKIKGKYPFKENGIYIFFGEIPNMPGHCIVSDHKTGKIYSGYHTDNFVELTGDEV